jgi:hypothetical protein
VSKQETEQNLRREIPGNSGGRRGSLDGRDCDHERGGKGFTLHRFIEISPKIPKPFEVQYFGCYMKVIFVTIDLLNL